MDVNAATTVKLVPTSCSVLAGQIENLSTGVILVDTRPSAQHCNNHIKKSENINCSNILLRRLLKGVVQLTAVVSSEELALSLISRDSEKKKLVIYDTCSTKDSIRSELLKYAEVLSKTEHMKESDKTVHFLDGGFEAFLAQYPHLCVASNSAEKKQHSPLGISISASLPILSFPSSCNRQRSRLQTPSADSNSQFGPPVEILPHLVLGCAKDSSNLTLLRKLGITSVLNVSHNCPNHFESILEYKSISVQDSYQADLLSKMEAAIEYINSIKAKNGRVFVHCHAGISRSATICISYIMKTMQMDLSNAYEFVKNKRPCISPNLHFMGQLLEFQKQLQESHKEHAEDNSINGVYISACEATDSASFVMSEVEEEVEEMDDYPLCCSSVPSASAPSSLNLEKLSSHYSINSNNSSQVVTKTARLHRIPSKPTTLPLLKSQSCTGEDGPVCGFAKAKKTLPSLSSTSLPTTPISQYKNHLPLTFSISQHRSTSPLHPLQHSPCRMVAQLGSRSESNLNYQHAPLTKSM